MKLLDGQKMLVTGGSRGIGAGIVRTAMEAGAEVAFIFRNNNRAAEQLTDEMESQYPRQRCLSFQCDVADTEGVAQTVGDVVAEFGRLDALVNNAGLTRDAAFARMTRAQWDEVMSTNLGSMFNVTQPLIMPFVKQRSGSIINVTSVAGIYGSAGQANYAASKAGIIGFTRALSKEVAPFGVRVNAVAPGFIETEMTSVMDDEKLKYMKSRIPAARLGASSEVGHLVCFLASDKAAYITGQVIQVDGGLTL
jgi:3-oxoacyl-[acyl-carrier protein] reductase